MKGIAGREAKRIAWRWAWLGEALIRGYERAVSERFGAAPDEVGTQSSVVGSTDGAVGSAV